MAEYNPLTDGWCIGCNKPKEKTAFLTSLNPNHPSQRLPLCRSCLSARMKQYREVLGSDGAALWCLCAELGYPVIREVYDIAVKRKDNSSSSMNLFTAYHSSLKEIGFVVQGFWQSDMMLDDFIKIGEDKQFEDKPEILNTQEMESIWGKYTNEEYQLLNRFFDMYTKEIYDMDYAMELRYRDLCKSELRKRKADESGDIQEIAKAEDSLRKNLALLKLDKFSDNKKSDIEKYIERMAWMIENTKPAECRDLDKYKDFSNFNSKWDEIMRCVKNLVAGTREYPNIPKDES